MLKKTSMILVCAATVTFVAAQLPWDSSPSDDSGSSGYENESSFSSSFSALTSESEQPFSEEETTGSSEDTDAKPGRKKRERTPKVRNASAGFSSQKSCPVCNSVKIKKNLYVEHGGQKIHVCSASCTGRVKRDPEAFVKVLEKRGESPEK